MEVNGERRGVRGRDRAVADEAWMRRMLEPAPVGVLSMVDGHRPVANVNVFALDRGGGVILPAHKHSPHLRPGRDYRHITPEELRRTTVVRVDVDTWHGREKRVDDDHAGGYPLKLQGWFGI